MAASKNPYPYLYFNKGVDWKDVNTDILNHLNNLGAGKNEVITITSGFRAAGHPGDGPNAGPGGTETQWYLWENSQKLGLVRGVTVAAPGSSDHQFGRAVDATVHGLPISKAFTESELAAVGLKYLPNDQVHVTYLSSSEGGTSAPNDNSNTTPVVDTTSNIDKSLTPAPAVDTTGNPVGPDNPVLASQIAAIPQGQGADTVEASLAGDQQDVASVPYSNAATWQTIAGNGQVSPLTLQLAQLAGYAANATATG